MCSQIGIEGLAFSQSLCFPSRAPIEPIRKHKHHSSHWARLDKHWHIILVSKSLIFNFECINDLQYHLKGTLGLHDLWYRKVLLYAHCCFRQHRQGQNLKSISASIRRQKATTQNMSEIWQSTLALKFESRRICDDFRALCTTGGLQCSWRYSSPLFDSNAEICKMKSATLGTNYT